MAPHSLYLPRHRFQDLIDTLIDAGYRCIGPQLRDATIVFDDLDSVALLPQGYIDKQGPGYYRLEQQSHQRYFAWANGPQGIKPYLFRAQETLWSVQRNADGHLHFHPQQPEPEHIAVIGLRGCDVAALSLQDAHFLSGDYADSCYAARREGLFVVAVNCSFSAATCFCNSTGDGPGVADNFDLLLSELDHGFVLEYGSESGRIIVERLNLELADDAMHAQAIEQIEHAAQQQRQLPAIDIKSSLFANLDHPRWQEVAERCLACGNCTSVCPSCFCHSEQDVPDLDASSSQHVRQWDSCFSQGHSYIHGTTVRADSKLRYRQWLTHKFSSWYEQYGRSGCTGCGRCISWCPVGIDVTEELAIICSDTGADDDA